VTNRPNFAFIGIVSCTVISWKSDEKLVFIRNFTFYSVEMRALLFQVAVNQFTLLCLINFRVEIYFELGMSLRTLESLFTAILYFIIYSRKVPGFTLNWLIL